MKEIPTLLQDILEAISSIETYSVQTYDVFLADEKAQDAIMFNLIIMGEAANKIPDDFQEAHPEIP